MKYVLVYWPGAPLQAQVMRQTIPNGITLSSATGTFVRKAGDTMTGRLTAPDITATAGITAVGVTGSSLTLSGNIALRAATERGVVGFSEGTSEGFFFDTAVNNDRPFIRANQTVSIRTFNGSAYVSRISVETGAAGAVIINESGTRLYIRTKAQLDAITPALGDMYTCSDCTLPYALCVGTGTTLCGFRRMDSATAGCGTNN